MSRVRADKWTDRAGTGAPTLTYGAQLPTGYGVTGAGGINITGIVTAGGWGGALSVTDTTASSSTSTGALIVSGGVGIAKSAYVGGNLDVTGAVSVGGTLTYEDVTNVDSIGVITARQGINVSAAGRGVNIAAGGLNVATGVGTFSAGVTITDAVISVGATVGMNTVTTTSAKLGTAVTFSQSYINFNQLLIEKTNTAGTTLGAATTCGLEKGMVYYCNGNESGNLTINFMHQAPTGDGNAGTALTSIIGPGETISPAVIITPNNSGVINAVQVDGVAQTFEENGGSFSAGSDGYDMYTFTMLRTGTGATDWLVLVSLTNHT